MDQRNNDVKNFWMQNLNNTQFPDSNAPGVNHIPASIGSDFMSRHQHDISPAISQQLMQEQESNPLNSGTMAAMKATKQALGMNEQQKQRALGSAIFSFFSNRAANPNKSNLQSISESLNPAMQAYLQEEANVKNQNKMLLDEHRKIERQEKQDAMQAQKMKEQSDYRNAMLQQRKDAFSGLSAYQKKMLEKGETKNGTGNIYTDQLKSNGLIPQDAVSFNSMKGERAAEIKRLTDMSGKGNQLQATLKVLDEMKEISDEFPNMNTSFSNALYVPEEKKGEGNIISRGFDVAQKKIMNAFYPKEMSALQKFAKLRSRLLSGEIKTVSGKLATDIFKKLLAEGVANFGHTKEAINYIIEGMKDEILPEYENSLEAKKMLSTRHVWPLNIKPLETNKTNSDSLSAHQSNIQNINKKIPTYSKQSNFISKMKMQHPDAVKDMSDDDIIQWGIDSGVINKE